VRVVAIVPRRVESASNSPRSQLGSADSNSARGSATRGTILSSKILMDSNSPLKELRLMNKKRLEMGGTMRNSARLSMTNSRMNMSLF